MAEKSIILGPNITASFLASQCDISSLRINLSSCIKLYQDQKKDLWGFKKSPYRLRRVFDLFDQDTLWA